MGVAVLKFQNGAMGVIEATTTIFPKNLEETLAVSAVPAPPVWEASLSTKWKPGGLTEKMRRQYWLKS